MTLALLAILFLLGASSQTVMMRALGTMGKIETKKLFESRPNFFFIFFWIKKCFVKEKWDSLFFITSFTKHILRIFYAITAFLYIEPLDEINIANVLIAICVITALALLVDFCIRLITGIKPLFMMKLATPFASFCILLFSPISFLLLKVQRFFFFPRKKSATKVRDTILELVQESELTTLLDPMDRRLITSVASFRDRLVKEIMVPRIDAFTLNVNQTIHEAMQKCINEGYSRIPVYEVSIDKIIGVVLFKDVMQYYYKCIEEKNITPLDTPLSKLVSPILYAPETKKISSLLQEFRRRQIHIAIVVDEYGGTEGIVTIEDILEELVGEIADEYDIDEERLFAPYSRGGFSALAKMNVLDIEKELGIILPPSPEYDTIGGYIFHKAGTIPQKGWRLHHDDYDIEVLESSERSIEKVWIIPHRTH